MKPILLPPNVAPHFYRGGSRLARLRGYTPTTDYGPEDWLAATVTRDGDPRIGLSATADGTLLADLIRADPVGWLGHALPLGANHVDTGVLVKLLDADQRLPVHVHPDREFARAHLHSHYGKTESWYVLDAVGDDPAVWLGFDRDVAPSDVERATDQQDTAWMLSRMNRIRVRPGDGILVPAGSVHAIGAGVFVVEAQEPTDFSILLEWSVTTAGADEAHLGLGMTNALRAVDCHAMTRARLDGLHVHVDTDATADRPVALLPAAADPFFRVDLLAPPGGASAGVPVAAGYAVLVVLAGSGELRGAAGGTPLSRGQVYAVPAGHGPATVEGDVRVVRVRPGTDPVDGPPTDPAVAGGGAGG